MEKYPQVAIIILNWNGEDFLKSNLDSVLTQDYKGFRVIVVDNASSDGSINFIKRKKKEYKNLELITLKSNLGFVGGNNVGLERVLKRDKYDFVVLLNNDVKVEKNWLYNLIDGFRDKNIGICTSKIYLYYPYQQIVLIAKEESTLKSIRISGLDYHALEFPEGFDKKGVLAHFPMKLEKSKIYNLAIPYIRGKDAKLEVKLVSGTVKVFSGSLRKEIKDSSSFDIDISGENIIQNAGSTFIKNRMSFEDRYIFEFEKDIPSEIVDAGCGASMAIRSDLLRRAGLLKKAYFMYNEDTELSFRLARIGYKTRFINNSICYHHFWGSSGGEVTERQTFYGMRNRLLFIREYFGIAKYFYYFARTFARSVVWGMKSFTGDKTARMYSENYFKALISSFKSYEK